MNSDELIASIWKNNSMRIKNLCSICVTGNGLCDTHFDEWMSSPERHRVEHCLGNPDDYAVPFDDIIKTALFDFVNRKLLEFRHEIN